MNKIKTQFSIKDLENLSGIKAHTIRIWEKRYQIFTPNRTQSNARLYTLEELQKLLNVSFLNSYGYKISRISKFTDDELNQTVNNVYSENTNADISVNALKIAMFTFDTGLFNETYNKLIQTKSFAAIFTNVYIPFLRNIGLLWQTDLVKPIHEHFISFLIFQKLIENISLAQNTLQDTNKETVYVLFLPENEVHEMLLLFINYQIISKGFKTIYLGANMPLLNLKELQNNTGNLHFVSVFTVSPSVFEINKYLKEFEESILKNKKQYLSVLGNQTQHIDIKSEYIIKYNSIEELINKI